MKSADTWSRFLRLAAHDVVDPFPGRLAQAWRIALACALTTMMAAIYGIPEAAISCYLVFFVMKPDAAQGSLLAVALAVLVVLVVLLLFMITRWTIEIPALRVVAIATSSLILLYLGSASKLGELGGIVALVLAFALTLLDYVPFGEAATRGILYAWLMATMPMACVLAVNLFLGRKPIQVLRRDIAERLHACADCLARPGPESRERLRNLVGDGQEDMLGRIAVTRLLALGRADEIRRLARAMQESYRIATIVLNLPSDALPAGHQTLARQARGIALALGQGKPVLTSEEKTSDPSVAAQEIQDALDRMTGTPTRYPRLAPGDSFFRSDAWTNPVHMGYAFKTTAAALVCYLIYTAVQWQGIHTALITCYVAALGSVAETTHKLLLRIVGCLIGAALGMGAILFLMPHMVSVGSIMVLVFVGTFLSAWVWVGNARVSYAGVQVALAFLLTVLQGFGPTFDLGTARDRIVGVLLGNCVLYFMMTQLWPVGVIKRAWDSLHQALNHLARMARPAAADMSEQDARDVCLSHASKLAESVAQAEHALALAQFESYRERPSLSDMRRLTSVADVVRQTSWLLTLLPAHRDAILASRLERLSALTASDASLKAPLDGASASASLQESSSPDSRVLDRSVRRLEALIDVC